MSEKLATLTANHAAREHIFAVNEAERVPAIFCACAVADLLALEWNTVLCVFRSFLDRSN
jgi:hypothetical protein